MVCLPIIYLSNKQELVLANKHSFYQRQINYIHCWVMSNCTLESNVKVNTVVILDKTMNDELIYIPYDDKHNLAPIM